MDGSTSFTCLDLTSAFSWLTIPEDDRHLTASCNVEGKLGAYVRSGFGLMVVPSTLSNHVGGKLNLVKEKGVRDWADDIVIPTRIGKAVCAYLCNIRLPARLRALNQSAGPAQRGAMKTLIELLTNPPILETGMNRSDCTRMSVNLARESGAGALRQDNRKGASIREQQVVRNRRKKIMPLTTSV